STIGRGTPAGATTPKNTALPMSGMPSSTTVGTSGQTGERSVEETTRPFMRPALTWLPVGSTTSQIMGTWPASTSRMAAAGPLSDTTSMLSLLRVLNSSIQRCGWLPMPEVAKRTFCGCLFTHSANSGPGFARTALLEDGEGVGGGRE